jgi:hypothetical protein
MQDLSSAVTLLEKTDVRVEDHSTDFSLKVVFATGYLLG